MLHFAKGAGASPIASSKKEKPGAGDSFWSGGPETPLNVRFWHKADALSRTRYTSAIGGQSRRSPQRFPCLAPELAATTRLGESALLGVRV